MNIRWKNYAARFSIDSVTIQYDQLKAATRNYYYYSISIFKHFYNWRNCMILGICDASYTISYHTLFRPFWLLALVLASYLSNNNYISIVHIVKFMCVSAPWLIILPHCTIQFSISLCYKTHAQNRWYEMGAPNRRAFRFYANKLIAYFDQRSTLYHIVHICISLNSQFNQCVLCSTFSVLICMWVRVSCIEYSKRSGSVQCTEINNLME